MMKENDGATRFFRCPAPPALLMAIALLFAPAAAWACRCVPRTPAAAARRADVVLLAVVERVVKDRPHFAEYGVRVVRVLKGRAPGRLTVKSGQTTCKADLAAGDSYLLYLRRGATGLETSLCAGNLPAAQAAGAIRALERVPR